jgi:hypothetical protein
MIGAMAIRWLFLDSSHTSLPPFPRLAFVENKKKPGTGFQRMGGEEKKKAWVTSDASLLFVFGSWQLVVARRCPSIDF